VQIRENSLAGWTREDGAQRAAQTIAVLPVGALEQHGPHLPLATDALLAEHIAYAATAELPGFVVAPTVSYGCSHHHLPYGATASLQTSSLLAALVDLTETLLASAFAGVFILNGHGGNAEVVQLTARDVSLTRQAFVAGGSYFQIAAKDLRKVGALDVGEMPGHAGAFETSLMLAAFPELVRPLSGEPASPPPGGWPTGRSYRLGSPGPFRPPRGYSDSPQGASAEAGQAFLEVCIEAVREALLDFGTVARDRD